MAVSISLLLSYVADWLVIIIFAIIGAVFNVITPNHRAFDLADPDISFPLQRETISVTALGLIGLLFPAVVIPVVCLLLVPGPTVARGIPKAVLWRRKLWEWHTGWLGLALSCATAFFFTQGLKQLFGRQRPDLLSRCNPDLAGDISRYRVGGLGAIGLEGTGVILVDWRICRQTDQGLLNDGFMSFPSGHASFSWSGLLYLSLFLCSKFNITVPYLLPSQYRGGFGQKQRGGPSAHGSGPSPSSSGTTKDSAAALTPAHPPPQAQHPAEQTPVGLQHVLRSAAAGPPVYLLALALFPVGLAMYVTATRYTDYRHHGFDLIVGSSLGCAAAYIAFRWFHAPIRRGAGWSWGPRSKRKAWFVGVGVQGYASGGEDEHQQGGKRPEPPVDVESGRTAERADEAH